MQDRYNRISERFINELFIGFSYMLYDNASSNDGLNEQGWQEFDRLDITNGMKICTKNFHADYLKSQAYRNVVNLFFVDAVREFICTVINHRRQVA